MTSAPIEGRGSTIHQLFNGHRYQLDYYQREYTWGSENVRRLVEDLHRRFSAEWNALHDRRDTSRYKPYFLGPYVYFQDGDITYLVDGQQRVTTLHLLLILIRNLLVDHDALSEARQLETLICNVMYGERRYTIDIAERAPLLDALMNGKAYEVKRGDPPSVRNLWERYGDLEEQFPSELAGEALPYFHDWLLHRVCLVGIEAHDQGHGWEIFETMNDRGLQLSPVDLLKSFLLARSEQTRPRRLNENWRKAMTGLSALGGMGAATDFVKALLVGRYADPRDADGLARIESSFHEWFRGNLTRMNLVRPADFADFVTDEFAPLAEAYCTLFSRRPVTGQQHRPALAFLQQRQRDPQPVPADLRRDTPRRLPGPGQGQGPARRRLPRPALRPPYHLWALGPPLRTRHRHPRPHSQAPRCRGPRSGHRPAERGTGSRSWRFR